MITRDQMRAARALLGWSQAELAKASGLAAVTVSTIEQGRNATAKSMEAIEKAFAQNGVAITPRGVEWKIGIERK